MNYLEAIGQAIRSEVIDPVLPSKPETDFLFMLYAVLALAKGELVTAQDVHNAWCAWMSQHDPAHPSIRPYEELDASTRAEDEPYVRAIQTVARGFAE